MNRGVRLATIVLMPFLALAWSGTARAAESSPVAAPTNLSMTIAKGERTLAEGSWISATGFTIHLQGAPGATPEVELEVAGTAFAGQANYTGPRLPNTGNGSVQIDGLQNATKYHWQIRTTDSSGNPGPWVAPGSGSVFDLAVDLTAPVRPAISSPTNPVEGRWYNNRVVTVNWVAKDPVSGIMGYSYQVLRQAHVIPPGPVTRSNSLSLTTLADGIWVMAVRAVDMAGNWSPTATYKIQLDRKGPQLIWLTKPGQHFNPYRGQTSVQFRFDKDASASLRLYRVGNKIPTAVYNYPHVVANRVITISWSGKDPHGQYVRNGYYYFAVQAIDRANNLVRWNAGGMYVTPQRPDTEVAGIKLYPDDGMQIFVSVSQERMWATSGDKIVMSSLVTTGNPNLPTPLGSYHIMEKLHPFEFISPWPEGSPYWYAPSWSQYAMLFREGGYYLHDAPWRSVFGPGSNGPGQPGTNFGGTHGCINMQLAAASFLFGWAPVGTPVNVVP